MTSSCGHNGTFKVFVSMETSREYGRGLLRGIYRYSSLHRQWQITLGGDGLGGRSTDDRHLLSAGVDGIIMRDHRGAPALLGRGIPIIFASHLHKNIRGSHRIVPDDQAIGRMAAAHLLERGFHHFAFVGYDGLYWSRQRQESFSRAVADAGCTCTTFRQARDLRLRVWRKEQKALADWLRTLARPVGLMACCDDRAREVVDACAPAGLTVPEEAAVLGVDNDEFVCHLSNPSISSIALGLEDAGYQAAMLLDELMKTARRKREARSKTNTDTHELAQTAGSVEVREGPCPSLQPSASQILVSPIRIATRQSSNFTAIEDPHVARAMRFIRNNCRQPIQIADIVQQVTISRRNLLDRFKQAAGCTLHQYVKRARVAQIEELLLGTSYSIARIAEILGFRSAEHIALYFRSIRGMNPRAYRARHAPRLQT